MDPSISVIRLCTSREVVESPVPLEVPTLLATAICHLDCPVVGRAELAPSLQLALVSFWSVSGDSRSVPSTRLNT